MAEWTEEEQEELEKLEPNGPTGAHKLFDIIFILKKYNCLSDFVSYRCSYYEPLIEITRTRTLHAITRNRKFNLYQLRDLEVWPPDLLSFIRDPTKNIRGSILAIPEYPVSTFYFKIPIFQGHSVLTFGTSGKKEFRSFFITIRSFEMIVSHLIFDATTKNMLSAIEELDHLYGVPLFTIENLLVKFQFPLDKATLTQIAEYKDFVAQWPSPKFYDAKKL